MDFATAGDWLTGSGNVTLNLALGDGFSYDDSYVIFSDVTTAASPSRASRATTRARIWPASSRSAVTMSSPSMRCRSLPPDASRPRVDAGALAQPTPQGGPLK